MGELRGEETARLPFTPERTENANRSNPFQGNPEGGNSPAMSALFPDCSETRPPFVSMLPVCSAVNAYEQAFAIGNPQPPTPGTCSPEPPNAFPSPPLRLRASAVNPFGSPNRRTSELPNLRTPSPNPLPLRGEQFGLSEQPNRRTPFPFLLCALGALRREPFRFPEPPNIRTPEPPNA